MGRAGATRPEPRPRPSPTRDMALGLTFVVLAFAGLARAFAPHTVDDAWITFRYSLQWAMGHGPVFNPDEHVEGYSNFLLMLVLTPIVRVAGAHAALPAAKGIGLGSALLAIVGAGVLARRSAGGARWAEVAGIAAAALVACSTAFAYHAMSGLETSLYACLLTWGVTGLVSVRGRGIVLGGVALALAALTRPEGPFVCALACGVASAVRAWGERAQPPPQRGAIAPAPVPWRALAIAGALLCVAVIAQLVFRHWAYDGEWLPNTFYAKTGGSGDRVAYVHGALRAPFLGDLGLLLALAGWAFGGAPASAALVPAIVGIVGASLPLAVGADWMPAARLVVPYLPLLAVTVAIGWARLLVRARRGGTGLLSALLLLSAPLALAFQWNERTALAEGAAIETAGAKSGHGALAAWLRGHAKPDDAIVLMDIGEVGYRCIEQRVVDVTGLTDRHIGKSPGTFMAKRFDIDYIWAKRPEFIVLTFLGRNAPEAPLHPFSSMEERLGADSTFQREYLRAKDPSDSTRLAGPGALPGAASQFEYATPGHRYVLAVYHRRD